MCPLSFSFASLCDLSAGAGVLSHKVPGRPNIVTVWPPTLAAGGVEVTDRASSERSVRPMRDVEAALRGAA